MKNSCELCKSSAKIYCESDQASLCWTCDTKVHSANFLVARHSRSLLCRVCRSPTPWTASGEKIGPSAVSVCEKCVGCRTSDGREEIRQRNDASDANDDDDDSDENENDVDVEYDGDEDGETDVDVDVDEDDGDENQVVPLAYTPPPAASSSSEDNYSYDAGDRCVSVKRKRDNVADLSEDDGDCLSVQKNRRDSSPASGEAIGGTGRTLYQFLPSCSEAMGEKQKIQILPRQHKISGESGAGAVTVTYGGTRTVGLDLNVLSDT